MPARQGQILLTAGEKADRRRIYPIVAGEMPQPLARARIQCKDDALERAAKHQVAGRRHDASPGRRYDLVLPLDRAGGRIDRNHLAPAFLRSKARPAPEETAAPALLALRGRMPHGVLPKHAPLLARKDLEPLR